MTSHLVVSGKLELETLSSTSMPQSMAQKWTTKWTRVKMWHQPLTTKMSQMVKTQRKSSNLEQNDFHWNFINSLKELIYTLTTGSGPFGPPPFLSFWVIRLSDSNVFLTRSMSEIKCNGVGKPTLSGPNGPLSVVKGRFWPL